MAQRLSFEDLGDVQAGHPNSGPYAAVLFWRLLLSQLTEALGKELGPERAEQLVEQVGETAGRQIYDRFLAQVREGSYLVRELSRFLKDARVAILRMEESDEQEMRLVFTLLEEMESPEGAVPAQARCAFNKGLVAGVLSGFYGRKIEVTKLECWGKGQRVCRLEARGDPLHRQTSVLTRPAPFRMAA